MPTETPATRLGHLTDLATPFAVRVAASLGVADHLAAGIRELDELAAAVGADPDTLGRLLRYLVHRGVFTEPAPAVFALTAVGRLLRKADPGGQGDWLDLAGLGARMDLAYAGLLHSVRTGEPAYGAVHGAPFWADLDANPAYRSYFDDLMLSQQLQTAPQVATIYDWTRVGHVIDVGGGSGGLLAELLDAHDHLRATLVDRPDPADTARRRFAERGLTERATVVTGDFFAELPTDGDVYVISRALTDWHDRDAVAILRRCQQAAAPDGRVLIVEVLPTEPHVPHQAPFDLQMLAVVGGRERCLADFEALADAAGLLVTAVIRGDNGLTLLDCACVSC